MVEVANMGFSVILVTQLSSMKYFMYQYIAISLIALFLFPQTAHAETSVEISNNGEGVKTNVNIESNTGSNTICQNGECKTTSNNGTTTSKVCVNGECFTGDKVDYKSEDGTTNVKINNATAPITTNATQGDIENKVRVESTTDDVEAEINKAKEEVDKKVAEQKQKIEEQEKKIEEEKNILQKLLDDLKDFFDKLF